MMASRPRSRHFAGHALVSWTFALASIASLLACTEARAQNVCAATDCVPPAGAVYTGASHMIFNPGATAIDVYNFVLNSFSACNALPASTPGAFVTWTVNLIGEADVIVAGLPQGHYTSGTSQATIKITFNDQSGGARIFDTELLALDVSGGNIPAGSRLRESPSLPSTGRAIVQPETGGGYRFSSYFDVYTELTQDNGQSWSPVSNGPNHLTLTQPSCGTPTATETWGRVRSTYR